MMIKNKKDSIILIVDDEQVARDQLKFILKDNYPFYEANSHEEAIEIITSKKVDIVLLDIWLNGFNGVETLREIKRIDKLVEVIMVTSDSTGEMINECVDLGANNYIKKPYKDEDILIALQISTKIRRRNLEYVVKDRMLAKEKRSYPKLAGDSIQVKKIHEAIQKVGKIHETTILISGESGTGKEIVARQINSEFGDPNRPFIVVNCAAIPENLVESELFGHEKGSFTGAIERKIGSFELADGGDIFLDEIAELPIEAQAKLLRVLEEKTFRRVGGRQIIESDFRLIAATNRDLYQMVEDNTFREDLYYRINIYSIEIPPLRERKEDIPLLINEFIRDANERLNNNISGVDNELLTNFEKRDWKGNSRALKNVIECMIIEAKTEKLSLRDLPLFEIDTGYINDAKKSYESFIRASFFRCKDQHVSKIIEAIERDLLIYALKNSKNQTHAANALGLSKSTMSEKVRKYGIEVSVI